jgi:hypothetical protein
MGAAQAGAVADIYVYGARCPAAGLTQVAAMRGLR